VENVEIKVGEEKVVIGGDLFRVNVEKAGEIAEEVFRFGELLARAEEVSILVDAEYRSWRAHTGHEILAKDPKMSEWKIRQRLEGSEEFSKFKQGIGIAQRNVVIIENVLTALDAKLQVLTSVLARKTSTRE